MILQSLASLYHRLSRVSGTGLAPQGYSLQEISLKVVLFPNGEFAISDFRTPSVSLQKNGREKLSMKPTPTIVPGNARPSEASFEPCFLWDDTRFIFGWHGQKNDPERNAKCRDAFLDYHLRLESEISDPDFTAVCNFLKGWQLKDASKYPDLLSIKKGRVVFQISSKTELVHDNEKIREWIANSSAGTSKSEIVGQCLVTGQSKQPIARLHPGIRNIKGAPYTGASLVSFNSSAYESHGKEGKDRGRGANSPTSVEAASVYTAALDWLLSKKQRTFNLADSTAVFWTDEPTEAEETLPWMLTGPPPAEDQATKDRISKILAKIAIGTIGADELGDSKSSYFILGMSLNQGRVSVRFWESGMLGDLISNLKTHYEQLSLLRQWDESNSKNPEPLAPTAKRLLLETTHLKDGRRDEEKVSPVLAGNFLRSILLGTRYPDTLINSVMNRIRVVEKKPKGEGSRENVSYLRASILKAWLMRNHHDWLNHHNINMKPALDKDTPHAAYQLGRLFAVYEQAQRAAHDYKLERTIRETMFSAASATPLAIFGRLDRLNKHHLPKLKPGTRRHLNDLMDEIHQKIVSPEFYPASLNLKEQSLFCIGYYHQRHEFRPKSITETTTEPIN
jgi:CRISPR-associated protein Csd1